MAFVDTTFPVENLRLVHGIQKSVALPTTVVGNSVKEYRIRKLANYRSSWIWPARDLSPVDREKVSQFYIETAGFSLNSFKFKCPYLHSWDNAPLLYLEDNKFLITARGTADGHPIFHLGNDVIVKHGGVALPSSAWSMAVDDDGRPKLTVPGVTEGITISGTFYHAARFDQASMGWTMTALSGGWQNPNSTADSLGDVSLIEVFEYDTDD